MSYHIQADPHPGRCLNWRQDQHDPVTGLPLSRRCLKTDLHEGPCRFEPRREFDLVQTHTWNAFIERPTPWVEPPEVA